MHPLLTKKDPMNEPELENLIKNYIKKSEELEARESKILEQVELIQSAVFSLQAWRESRKPSTIMSESAPIDLKEVEEETKKIKEETRLIQEEINRKIAENKKLEEEVFKKKNLIKGDIHSAFHKIVKNENPETEEIENRDSKPLSFKEKLMELEKMEKKLKNELSIASEEFRRRSKSQNSKVTLLEWELLYHGDFVDSLKKQNKM